MAEEKVVELKDVESLEPGFGKSDLRIMHSLLGFEHLDFVIGIFPPGGDLPPHYHTNAEELYYIYKGEITVHAGDRTYIAKEGTGVNVPPKVVHWPYNHTDKDCEVVFVLSPPEKEGELVVTEE